jgi:hypothetical protein
MPRQPTTFTLPGDAWSTKWSEQGDLGGRRASTSSLRSVSTQSGDSSLSDSGDPTASMKSNHSVQASGAGNSLGTASTALPGVKSIDAASFLSSHSDSQEKAEATFDTGERQFGDGLARLQYWLSRPPAEVTTQKGTLLLQDLQPFLGGDYYLREGVLIESQFRGWTQSDNYAALRNVQPFTTFCMIGYWNETLEKAVGTSCLVFAFGLLDNIPFAAIIDRNGQGGKDKVLFSAERQYSEFGPLPTLVPSMDDAGWHWSPYLNILKSMREALLEAAGHQVWASVWLSAETDKALDMWRAAHVCYGGN